MSSAHPSTAKNHADFLLSKPLRLGLAAALLLVGLARPAHPNPVAASSALAYGEETYTYSETFQDYSRKDVTTNTVWDPWQHELRLMRSDATKNFYASTESERVAVGPDGNAVIVWIDSRAGSMDLYAQKMDSLGNRLWENDVRVNQPGGMGGGISVTVDAANNAYVSYIGSDYGGNVTIQKLDPSGHQLWAAPVMLADSQTSGTQVRAMPNGKVWVGWVSYYYGAMNPDFYAQQITADGTPVFAAKVRVNAASPVQLFGQWDMAVAPNGSAVFVWDDKRSGNTDIYMQKLSSAGARQWDSDRRANSQAPYDQNSSRAAFDASGNLYVMWSSYNETNMPFNQQVYLQKIDGNGFSLWGDDVSANPNGPMAGSYENALATDLYGNIYLAWDLHGNVYTQRMDGNGLRLWDAPIMVNSDLNTNWEFQRIPAIAADSAGRLFVAWMNFDSTNGVMSVYARQLQSSGVKNWASEMRVNWDSGTANQLFPDIAVAGDSTSFVAWVDTRRGYPEIYAQSLDADGSPRWGTDIRVNTTPAANIGSPTVALVNNETFLIIWQGSGCIWAQKMDIFGNKLWQEDVLVAPGAAPDVAVDMSGNAYIVFTQTDPQKYYWSENRIQKLSPAGVKQWSIEKRISRSTGEFEQLAPSVSVEGGGNVVVAWRQRTWLPAKTDLLYAQRLNPSGSPLWAADAQVNYAPVDFSQNYGLADPHIDVDGNSGTVITWVEETHMKVLGQKLNSSGNRLWNGGNDKLIATPPIHDGFRGTLDLVVAVDGNFFLAIGLDNWPVIVRSYDDNGNETWKASTHGTNGFYWFQNPSLAVDDAGNSFVVWNDQRNANWDVFIDRVNWNGVVPWDGDRKIVSPDYFYLPSGSAKSRNVNTSGNRVYAAQLTASDELFGGTVTYYLSVNGGRNWYPVVSGVTYFFPANGLDLRWRADLAADPLWPRAPVVHSLQVQYWTVPFNADDYEPDDICGMARPLDVDGMPQLHNFHQQADADWTSFQVVSGETYIVRAAHPGAEADTVLEIYDPCPGEGEPPLIAEDNPLGRDLRLTLQAAETGTLFARVTNADPFKFGDSTNYQWSVRAARNLPVAVIVAAQVSDPIIQSHINNAADLAYRTFLESDIQKQDLRYFAPGDPRDVDGNGELDDIYAQPEAFALRDSIQDWARQQGAALGVPFFLVLIGDCSADQFLINGPGSGVRAEDLDLWLGNLEATSGTDSVNVVIEAPRSGSFIDVTPAGPGSISGYNRLVITSTTSSLDAYLSTQGFYFSDAFFTALGQNDDMKSAFDAARQALLATGLNQQPWLDDNGDSLPELLSSSNVGSAAASTDGSPASAASTSSQKAVLARGRGLQVPSPASAPQIDWARVGEVTDGTAAVSAQVSSEAGIKDVWMVVYPPGFKPPSPQGAGIPVISLPSVQLLPAGSGLYEIDYSGFTLPGPYKVVIYAADVNDRQALPRKIYSPPATPPLFLPKVSR